MTQPQTHSLRHVDDKIHGVFAELQKIDDEIAHEKHVIDKKNAAVAGDGPKPENFEKLDVTDADRVARPGRRRVLLFFLFVFKILNFHPRGVNFAKQLY